MRLVAALALALGGAAPAAVAAQDTGRVVGRVTEVGSGAPIAEAQVSIPGLALGTLTRSTGQFIILQVPAGTHEIRVDRIGLAPVTREVIITAGQSPEVNFEMATQALRLDEIVVTGTAGAARRREVGNTINEINVADAPNRSAAVPELLQAAAPGIQVNKADGAIGQGFNIRLRGNRTISMTNQPIIYIDGIRMQSKPFPVGNSQLARRANGGSANIMAHPLNNINPNDIERIEVIKGSAATTLYGTEASSGVIQVFTKKGSAGAPIWTLDLAQNFVNSLDFGTESHPKLRMEPYLRGGRIGSYSGSVRGGGQNLQYFASVGFEEGIGILPNDSISKWMARGNFTFTPADNVVVQWNTSYAFQDQRNSPVGGNVYGITLNAYRGIANYINSDHPDDLFELFDQELTLRIERFTTGGTVSYSPFNNLTNRFTVGYENAVQETRNVLPFGFSLFEQGQVWNDTWKNSVVSLDYVGTYSFDVIGGLRSNFSWGGQAVGVEEINLNGYGENFPGAGNPTINSAALKVAAEDRAKVWNAGFFFQNVFDISNRYFITLGARIDGNSTFGNDFGLQFYPKASASWVISDEDFWRDGWGAVKLRAAYGQAGRAPGAFDATRTWSSNGWGGRSALLPENLGAEDLGPEVTSEFEIGFDGEWLDGALASTFTYYHQITSDALFNVDQIPTTGFAGSQRRNVGKLKNSGIELMLTGSPVRTANWGWDLGLSVTTNNSEVLDLGGIAPFSSRGAWVEEGHPVGALRSRWLTNPYEVAEPDFTSDRVIHGPTQPTLSLGPSTTVRLPGGVSVSARGEYRSGHFLQQNVTSGGVTRSGWMPVCWEYYVNPYDGALDGYNNPSGFSHDLKPETPGVFRAHCNPSTSRRDYSTAPADFFVLRTLSAQIPLDVLLPDRVSSSTLTLSMNNNWWWFNDKWQILTPEVGDPDDLVGRPDRDVPPVWSFSASVRTQF